MRTALVLAMSQQSGDNGSQAWTPTDGLKKVTWSGCTVGVTDSNTGWSQTVLPGNEATDFQGKKYVRWSVSGNNKVGYATFYYEL